MLITNYINEGYDQLLPFYRPTPYRARRRETCFLLDGNGANNALSNSDTGNSEASGQRDSRVSRDKTPGSISERKRRSWIQMLLRESTSPIFPGPMAALSSASRPSASYLGSFFLWVRCFQAENKIMAQR